MVAPRVKANEVLMEGFVAVVTGCASGIGKAMAIKFGEMQASKIYMVDVDAEELNQAAARIKNAVPVVADVADAEAMEALAVEVFKECGKVNFLALNAGVGRSGGPLESLERWHKTFGINFYGVVHGTHAFLPKMQASKEKGLIVITGSKQGITAPPGTGCIYNCSKAALKVYVESLEHSLRNTENSLISASLLIPGWVNSSIFLKSKRDQAREENIPFSLDSVFFHEDKPADGAWMPMQVIDFMLDQLNQGKFYIICPDNETSRQVDNARMTWAMQDLTQDRPPLSRWHPDYKDKFTAFLNQETS
mmetsp:Transcript_23290/g.28010  ORF Transcript_23290/g.28010 Transcript_23290/m.28010 type:complete len:306 (-) Transcript_23290:57-974(-)